MRQKLHTGWRKVPSHIRRPIVLIIGMFFVILAGSIGWLPGPGGIPLFLVGVAILATEFEWAERLKQFILRTVRDTAHWVRANPRTSWLFGLILVLIATVIAVTFIYIK